MKTIYKSLTLSLFLSAFSLLNVSAETTSTENWVTIFNGKDLDGWTPKIKGHPLGENYNNTFRAENGVIKVGYDQYGKFNGEFGHLFYKEKLSNYRVRFEYRFVGRQCEGGPAWANRNSGIMLHCQAPDTMQKDQDFPVSVEFQLLGGDGTKPRTTGNLCTPGTNVVLDKELFTPHCTSSNSETYHGDQWVTAEAEVHADKTIRHIINSKVVMEYEQPQLDEKDPNGKTLIKDGVKLIKEGYIALQAESSPVEFRKIELLKLPESPK